MSNIIYQVSCKDCSKFYIGKTTRNFCIRLEEHLSTKNKNDSLIRKHMDESKHIMDLDRKLLDKASTNQKLLLKEMLHINRLKLELNVQEQSELFCLLIGKNKAVSHN